MASACLGVYYIQIRQSQPRWLVSDTDSAGPIAYMKKGF
jgi:hypothetical protein